MASGTLGAGFCCWNLLWGHGKRFSGDRGKHPPLAPVPRALGSPAWLVVCVGPAAASEEGPEVGGWHPGCHEVPLGEAAGVVLGKGWGLGWGSGPVELRTGSAAPASHLLLPDPSPSPRALGAPRSDHGLQVTNSARLLLRWVFLNAHPFRPGPRVKQCADDLNLTVLCGRLYTLPPTAGRRWRLRGVKSGALAHTGWSGAGPGSQRPCSCCWLALPALLPCLRSRSLGPDHLVGGGHRLFRGVGGGDGGPGGRR